MAPKDHQDSPQGKDDKSPRGVFPREDKKTVREEKMSLKDRAKDKLKNNPSALGDPVSLKAETSDTEPTENDKGAKGDKEKDSSSGKPKL